METHPFSESRHRRALPFWDPHTYTAFESEGATATARRLNQEEALGRLTIVQVTPLSDELYKPSSHAARICALPASDGANATDQVRGPRLNIQLRPPSTDV